MTRELQLNATITSKHYKTFFRITVKCLLYAKDILWAHCSATEIKFKPYSTIDSGLFFVLLQESQRVIFLEINNYLRNFITARAEAVHNHTRNTRAHGNGFKLYLSATYSAEIPINIKHIRRKSCNKLRKIIS